MRVSKRRISSKEGDWSDWSAQCFLLRLQLPKSQITSEAARSFSSKRVRLWLPWQPRKANYFSKKRMEMFGDFQPFPTIQIWNIIQLKQPMFKWLAAWGFRKKGGFLHFPDYTCQMVGPPSGVGSLYLFKVLHIPGG